MTACSPSWTPHASKFVLLNEFKHESSKVQVTNMYIWVVLLLHGQTLLTPKHHSKSILRKTGYCRQTQIFNVWGMFYSSFILMWKEVTYSNFKEIWLLIRTSPASDLLRFVFDLTSTAIFPGFISTWLQRQRSCRPPCWFKLHQRACYCAMAPFKIYQNIIKGISLNANE